MTSMFVLGVIQMGENSYQSLLGVKGANLSQVEITFIYLLLTDHHKVLILSHNILRLLILF